PGATKANLPRSVNASATSASHWYLHGLTALQRDAGNRAVALLVGSGDFPDQSAQVMAGPRTAGNAAVTSLLHVQRRDPVPAGGAASSARTRGAALEARVKKSTTTSRATSRAVSTGLTSAVADVDQVLVQLNGVAKTYESSYESYQKVIEEAEAREAAIDAVAALVVGVLISTGVGVGLGLAAPLAATATRGMLAFAEARNATVAALLAAGSAGALPSKGRPSTAVAGFADQHPTMMKVKAYQQAADLYRTLALTGARFGTIADIQFAAAQLQADCRELAVSGRHRTSTEAAIAGRVTALEADAKTVVALKSEFDKLFAKVGDAKVDASLANQDASATRMERDIWVYWMASLSGDQAEILDSDPIEARLGLLNLMAKRGMDNAPQRAWQSDLDWGVGAWHSDDDSREGARKARGGVAMLKMVGQQGRFRAGGAIGGEYVSPSGAVFAAAPSTRDRSEWDLDGKTVIVMSVSLSSDLVWVDLPEAAQEDRRGTYLARTMKGKTVTLKGIREEWRTNQTWYFATATSVDDPGLSAPARVMLGLSGTPTEGITAVVRHAEGKVLVVEPSDGRTWWGK
ncbi:MAG: hypothetical protein L0H26_08310, partial [Microlunatus sp.]|nr:hypothetical protein [Microlunatus sp.]